MRTAIDVKCNRNREEEEEKQLKTDQNTTLFSCVYPDAYDCLMCEDKRDEKVVKEGSVCFLKEMERRERWTNAGEGER